MRKALRWIFAVVGSASVVLLVTMLIRARPPQGLSLRFEGGYLAIPFPMRSGEEYDFPIEVVNDSSESARLIGALEYCAGSCYSVSGLPVEIPTTGRNRVSVHIKARVPGDFVEDVTLYTDRPSQPTLVLKVFGTIEEAGHVDSFSPAE